MRIKYFPRRVLGKRMPFSHEKYGTSVVHLRTGGVTCRLLHSQEADLHTLVKRSQIPKTFHLNINTASDCPASTDRHRGLGSRSRPRATMIETHSDAFPTMHAPLNCLLPFNYCPSLNLKRNAMGDWKWGSVPVASRPPPSRAKAAVRCGCEKHLTFIEGLSPTPE